MGIPPPILLEAVISGGQTGADEAGLAAALSERLRTGGMAPKNYMTEIGENWTLKTRYGLQEAASTFYKPRTWWNVTHSDGTVIFTRAGREGTHITYGGSHYTQQLCIGNHKPCLVLDPWNIPGADGRERADLFRAWLADHKIITLNVAGNRESVSPGIFKKVYDYLTDAFIPF